MAFLAQVQLAPGFLDPRVSCDSQFEVFPSNFWSNYSTVHMHTHVLCLGLYRTLSQCSALLKILLNMKEKALSLFVCSPSLVNTKSVSCLKSEAAEMSRKLEKHLIPSQLLANAFLHLFDICRNVRALTGVKVDALSDESILVTIHYQSHFQL